MKILVISFSDLKNDPRVFRQISRLYKNNEVTCIGYHHPGLEPVTFIQYTEKPQSAFELLFRALLLIFGRYEQFEQRKHAMSGFAEIFPDKEKFDLIIANDLDALLHVMNIRRTVPILYDAHEYSPAEFEDNFLWKLLHQKYRQFLCRKYLPRCDRVTTVSEGIAKEYHTYFGVRPDIITSASDFVDIPPREVNSQTIRIIHHGAAISSRKLEKMVFMMDHTDPRFTLDLMLVPNEKKFYNYIVSLVDPRKNVRIVDPVPMDEIVKKCNEYDIGLYLLAPTNLNSRFALPNKFFEFVQSRLAIAIGPSPEMARLVKKYDLGVVSDDFSPLAMAECLNSLTSDQIQHYKMQAHSAARVLSSEENMKKFDAIIADLTRMSQSQERE